MKECAWFVCIPFWKANLLLNFGRVSTFGRKGDKKASCRVVPSAGKQEGDAGRLSSHLCKAEVKMRRLGEIFEQQRFDV